MHAAAGQMGVSGGGEVATSDIDRLMLESADLSQYAGLGPDPTEGGWGGGAHTSDGTTHISTKLYPPTARLSTALSD